MIELFSIKNIEFIYSLRVTFENRLEYQTYEIRERVHLISDLLGIDENINFRDYFICVVVDQN